MKAQISQSFVYITALIIIALILFFGFSSIKDILNIGEKVEFIKFVDNLNDKITKYYNLDVGTSEKTNIDVPKGIAYICIIDHAANMNFEEMPKKEKYENLLRITTNKNVFFIPLDLAEFKEPIKINNLKPKEKNPLCLSTKTQKLKAIIKNEGKYVSISELKNE